MSHPITLASRTARLASSAIGSVLRLADAPELIALAAGSPAPETFGVDAVARIAAELLATGPNVLQYGDTEGLWELREWLAADQGALLGRDVRPEGTVLTHGSQQGLDLLCKALLNPGDVVFVDQPSYLGALQVFRLFEADVVPVPIAAEAGLDELESTLRGGVRPRLLYVVSNFANPTGLTLGDAQRRRLVELADRYGFLLVEDDPYGYLYYTGHERPPALAALSLDVVRLSSFSKVLFPAARLGHLTAPQPLVDVLNKLKQAADLGNSLFVQRIVNELVRTPGLVPDRLAIARKLYRERRDALAGALDERLSFAIPDGGFFVWARLPDGLSATALLTAALAEGVSFVPGQAFFAADADDATLRLSFSCATAGELVAAGPRLTAAIDSISR